MTYEIEIIEPRAQKLLEELVNLNLIKFVQSKRKKVKKKAVEDAPPTRAEIKTLPRLDEYRVPTKEEFLNDLRESVAEMKAHLRGEIKLPSFEESIKRIELELAQEELIAI